MPNQFSSTEEIIRGVEMEFGEPFAELLNQLAKEGESISSAAGVIGVSNTWLYRWLKKEEVCIEWPSLSECNARRAADEIRAKGAKHRAASAKNIRRAWEVNNQRHAAARQAHAGLTLRAIELNSQGHGWRQIPALLGVDIDPCTLRRRAKREFNYVSKQR